MIRRIPFGRPLPDYRLDPPDEEPLIRCPKCKKIYWHSELDHLEDEYCDWAYYCPNCGEELFADMSDDSGDRDFPDKDIMDYWS